jgi:chromosome segregation ATPase
MSVSALHIYEQLTDAPDDKARARIIAEAIGQLEDRYPQLREVATQPQLRETELRLQKEIQLTRLEIKEVEANLQKEIQQTRLEIKEVEARLQKEIREVEARLSKEIHLLDLKIAENTSKIAETKAELVRWVVGVGLLQTTLISGILLKVAHLI